MILSRKLQKMPPLPSEKAVYKAAVLEAPGEVKVREAAMPEPKDDEVRIRLEGSGVCASNIPVWEGREWFDYPFAPGAPGHEGWGVVDSVGKDVKILSPRVRVTGLTYNAYATYDIAKPENLVVLPDFLEDKAFPGEPLGCAMNIFERSGIKKKQTVAVVGCGFLGLLLIQLAKAAGATVIAISKRDFSLASALFCGADMTIKMEDHYEIIEKVREFTKDGYCDRVLECTGKEWPLNLSIELTAERGRLVVAGYHQDGMRQVNMQMLNWRGIDMISAHERDVKQYVSGIEKAIEAVQTGKMNPFPLFTHAFSLEDIDSAFKNLINRPPQFIKALVLNPQ